MKRTRRLSWGTAKGRRLAIRLAVAAALAAVAIYWLLPRSSFQIPEPISAAELLQPWQPDGQQGTPNYVRWLLAATSGPDTAAGAQPTPRPPSLVLPAIELQAASYTAASAEASLEVRAEAGGGDREQLYWNNDRGWVEWTLPVEEAGFYELHFGYYPLKGSTYAVVRGLQVDGEYSYIEAQHIEFVRHWKDAQFPYERNAIGHEIRSVQTELEGWKETAVASYSASSEPLLFYFEAGEHKLRLIGEQGAVAFSTITAKASEPIPTYSEYMANGQARQQAASGTSGEPGTSNEPGASREPAASGAPAASGEPNASDAPSASREPAASGEPDAFAAPGASTSASGASGGGQPGEWFAVIEAEQYTRKSSLMIQTDNRSEPYISPDPQGRIRYNVLGGDRWRNPGEWLDWTFEVPEEGWYELDLKLYQGYKEGFHVYRTIMIDGKVPHQDMLHYPIASTQDFEIVPIQDQEGQPYRFYLEQGEHELRMIADASPMQPAFLALKDTLNELSAFDRNIRLLTGNYSKSAADANLDVTRTWDLKRYDPQVEEKLAAIITRFREVQQFINAMNQQSSDLSEAIKVAIDMLERLLADVDEIPNKINDFSTIQNNIGTWISSLTQEPLLLDYLVVRTPGTDTGLKAPTPLARIPYSILNFGRSFVLDYDMRKHNREQALTIWVQRGRDYVELLREMAAQDFTPRTGIEVNINLMPNPNMLILGNAAGEVPDVALGLGESMPADYAMRDAVADLSQFTGFDEVMARFLPGVSRAMRYNGGTYGIPEVQNFQVLYYRTDIFAQLGLEVPDTWEDLFDILPTLQENGMAMFYPKGDFTTLFYEHGAEFYSEDGLSSRLDTQEAYTAFKQWTDLFTKYNLPIDVPAFFQHFRDGDIPLGIADFNTYVQLLVAAPEITGQWQIAPLPGIRQDNGEVARWSSQGLSAAMIMNKSERQEDAWKFIAWWTSAEVQSQYARDIESFYGLEFRWNTANVEAMGALSWPSEDLQALREQARWAKNAPYVPGYYFLGREMEFAWNRTVLDGMPAQEALELAHLSLQREMDRRQLDFGIGKSDDLQTPLINAPYEWREQP